MHVIQGHALYHYIYFTLLFQKTYWRAMYFIMSRMSCTLTSLANVVQFPKITLFATAIVTLTVYNSVKCPTYDMKFV